jgi:hypothetical protein
VQREGEGGGSGYLATQYCLEVKRKQRRRRRRRRIYSY